MAVKQFGRGPFTTNKQIEELVYSFLAVESSARPKLGVTVTLAQFRKQPSSSSSSKLLMAPCMSVSPSPGDPRPPPGGDDNTNRDRIIAAICSALLLTGGVAIIVVTGGAATPGLLLAQSVLINAGLSSAMLNYRLGDNFTWSEWTKGLVKNVGITLITFGAGFACGAIVGFALTGHMSEMAVRGLGALAGALAGAGIHTGVYVLECRANGRETTWYELVLTGLGGALSGATAGYLGADVTQKWMLSGAERGEELVTMSDNQGNKFTLRTSLDDEKLKNIIKQARNGKLKGENVQRIIDNSNVRSVGGEVGHADIHVLELDPVTNDILVSVRDKLSSLFVSPEQQSRFVHEALLANVDKLEALQKTASVTINYKVNELATMLIDNGSSVSMANIDHIIVTLRKTGDGFLHIVTAFPV